MSLQPGTTDSSLSPSTVPLFVGTPPVRRFTVDQYHRMIETGILTENDHVELLDGWILEMSPVGPPHATCVSLIVDALQQKLPSGWLIRAQSPITLAAGEPEPDVTVVQGSIRDYRDRHPSGPDIGLLVEVADSSLQFDRLQKRPQYAAAGIPEYWIVNLVDRCLEVYSEPITNGDYQRRHVVDASGSVEVQLAGRSVGQIAVVDLLP
jgi:Uma2 family endonuclease